MLRYTVTKADSDDADVVVSLSTLVRNARLNENLQGPLPVLRGKPMRHLLTNETHLVRIDGIDPGARSVGMMTCATVVYVSTEKEKPAVAWIHHANTGHIRPEEMETAIKKLGDPEKSNVLVIYAHERIADKPYQSTINSLIEFKIPSDNIIQIPNLNFANFGINGLGQLGY